MSIYCKYLYFNKKRFIMSAGICIMNKKAVAMAADSAVTISGDYKAVHNSVNKLFSLSQIAPVGVIIYSNSSFMSVPMEIIIKQYRKQLDDKSFPCLNDYVNDFLHYITDKADFYHFNLGEKTYVYSYFYFLSNLLNQVQNRLYVKEAKPLTNESYIRIFDSTYNFALNYLKRQQKKENYSYFKYIKDNYHDDFVNIIKADDNLDWLTNDQIDNLYINIENLFDSDFDRNGYVGFTITGYGENEIYPSVFNLHLSGLLNSKLKYKIVNSYKISNDNPSKICPLAQRDVIDNFFKGIDDKLRNQIRRIPLDIYEHINKLDDGLFTPGNKEIVLNEVQVASGNIVKNIRECISKNFELPLLESIETLPIEELALLAESMINITSIRRKVIVDQNNGTVGGPIDVAIISKGDGFVWIKRKNYFDVKYNPQYLFSTFHDYDYKD